MKRLKLIILLFTILAITTAPAKASPRAGFLTTLYPTQTLVYVYQGVNVYQARYLWVGYNTSHQAYYAHVETYYKSGSIWLRFEVFDVYDLAPETAVIPQLRFVHDRGNVLIVSSTDKELVEYLVFLPGIIKGDK